MQENGLNKVWAYSQLNTAINSLTYGLGCLYYDKTQNKLLPCTISIHEEYINILHVIIQNEFSVLFELQDVKNISDRDLFIKQRLKSLNYENFIIVYTSTLDNHVIVMPSENQIDVLWEGLQYFVYEAIQFYSRISLMDPFKAETTMVFMDADSDGSRLLDIDEVLSVFKKLRINKTKAQIEQGIHEINSDLYEKQNLKKPKDFTLNKLTPLGFQYLLQFYSLKSSLAPLFTQFCPLFKFKHKQYKKSIVDILKNQEKPLMSAGQFQQFLQKYILVSKTQAECTEIIKSFPVYDGEGQQIPEQVEYLSFHSFCNYVYSSNNSITDQLRTEIYQEMNLPLNEYFVYSSNFSKLNLKSSSNLLQMYELSLKKGCRCLSVSVQEDKEAIVVKNVMNREGTLLSDVLKTIKNLAFSFNSYPVIISIQANISSAAADKTASIIKKQIGQNLYFPLQKNKHQHQTLPSPKELKNKFVLQLIGNNKKNKEEQNQLTKIVALMPTKLDFERKGLTSWDSCHIPVKDLLKYQELENKNLTDYCRKAIVRTQSQELLLQLDNYDPMPMFRNGIQLIAHNVQKQDENQYLIHSKFYENGGRNCGYLLKPHWMRSDCKQSLYSTNFLKIQFIIKIKIFAGQKYVLKENTKGGKFKLEVKIKGTKLEQQKNKKYQSEAKNEGFYTDFDMDCQFQIYCSQLSTIFFSILDEDQIVSARGIPVNIMRLGLKTVELFGPGMELNLNSCLLVYVQKAEDKNKRKIAELLS